MGGMSSRFVPPGVFERLLCSFAFMPSERGTGGVRVQCHHDTGVRHTSRAGNDQMPGKYGVSRHLITPAFLNAFMRMLTCPLWLGTFMSDHPPIGLPQGHAIMARMTRMTECQVPPGRSPPASPDAPLFHVRVISLLAMQGQPGTHWIACPFLR